MDRWIQDLVYNEIEMSEKGVINSQKSLDQQKIKNSALAFLNEIRKECVSKVQSFNELRKDPSFKVKIYSTGDDQSGFMLFRNHYKMVFSMEDFRTVSVTNNSIPVEYRNSNQDKSMYFKDELKAKFNTLGEVNWYFKREKINPSSLARYYVTKFIQDSFHQ